MKFQKMSAASATGTGTHANDAIIYCWFPDSPWRSRVRAVALSDVVASPNGVAAHEGAVFEVKCGNTYPPALILEILEAVLEEKEKRGSRLAVSLNLLPPKGGPSVMQQGGPQRPQQNGINGPEQGTPMRTDAPAFVRAAAGQQMTQRGPDPNAAHPPSQNIRGIVLAEQKQILGEMLFPLIANVYLDLAAKITGMLLECDNAELLLMLEQPEQLKSKVDESVLVLKSHIQAAPGATAATVLAERLRLATLRSNRKDRSIGRASSGCRIGNGSKNNSFVVMLSFIASL